MQILTKLWNISQVSYLLHSSNQQPSPANTDHPLRRTWKNCTLFLLSYVLTASSTSYRVPWGQKLYFILSLSPLCLDTGLCFQRITSVSVFWEGSVLKHFFNPLSKSIFIQLTKIRSLLSIILQVLASFILKAHALKKKPGQKPSSTTYYVILGKFIHFSQPFSLST